MSPLFSERDLRFAMVRVVTLPSLEQVIERIAHEARTQGITLDFAGTLHLDYRAFRWFADRISALDRSQAPIRLAGCSPYVRSIVEFALSGTDWEQFVLEIVEENLPETPRGLGVSRRSLPSGERAFQGGLESIFGFAPPCPN